MEKTDNSSNGEEPPARILQHRTCASLPLSSRKRSRHRCQRPPSARTICCRHFPEQCAWVSIEGSSQSTHSLGAAAGFPPPAHWLSHKEESPVELGTAQVRMRLR